MTRLSIRRDLVTRSHKVETLIAAFGMAVVNEQRSEREGPSPEAIHPNTVGINECCTIAVATSTVRCGLLVCGAL